MKTLAMPVMLSVVCMCACALAQQPQQADVAPALKIVDSQEVDVGDYSIIYNRVETPVLKPESAQPVFEAAEPIPLTAQELEENRKWEAKFHYAPSFWVTVYDGKFSEVRWWEDGKENVVWSNINFLHFAPLADVVTDQAYYSMMLFGWETTTGDVQAMNAVAQSGAELMSLPPATLPLLATSGPQWMAASALSDNAKRAMNDLHEHYRIHGSKLAENATRQAEEAKAQEAWAKAHPPIPQDIVVNFFPIRSSTLKNHRPEEAAK